MAEQEVTLEQANEALRQLANANAAAPEPTQQAQAEVEQAAEVEPAPTAETTEPVAQAAPTDVSPPPETESDDVASLHKRLEASEAERKQEREKLESRLRAVQERSRANESIVRDRYIRKSAVVDKAHRILKAVRTESGADPADIDGVIRDIEGTLNPASANYSPPQEQAPSLREDQAIVMNEFLNDKGMDTAEAEDFGKWMRTEGSTALSDSEQRIAGESLRGFLHLAHDRWQKSTQRSQEPARNDAVEVVKAVQRTQRQAARAAAPTTPSPRKQPAAPKAGEIDWDKMSEAEQTAMVSKLVRQSVEQYH